MAFNAGRVEGSLELEADDFLRALRQTRGELDKLRKDQKRATSSTSRFQSALQTAANATIVAFGAIRAAKAVVGPIIGAFKEASSAAAEYDQAVDSLASTLALRGAEGVAALTSELEAQASRLQQATAFGDTDVLGVQQTLSALGVATPKLEEYTQAVLDVAAATDREANETAKQFAKTLGGQLGEVRDLVPGLEGLENSALKSGAAFDAAREQYGGFAELVGQSDQAVFATFGQTLGDLRKEVGFLINEVAGPLASQLTDRMSALVEQIKSGGPEAERFKQAFVSALKAAAGAGKFVVDAGVSIFAAFKDAQAGVAQLQATAVSSARKIAEAFDKVAEFLGFEGISDSTIAFLNNMEEAAQGVADEALKASTEAHELADSVKDGTAAANGLLGEFLKVRNVGDDLKRNAQAEVDARREAQAAASRQAEAERDIRDALNDRLKKLREINGVSFEVKDSTGGIANEAARAAGEAGKMAQGFRAAAGAAREASSALAGRNPDGSLDFGEDEHDFLSASRHVASRSPVDTSDPFRAVAAVDSARESLRRVGSSAFAGGTQIRAARAFLDDVRAQANASIDRAVSEFTGEVLRELNEGGIDDPARRSRILRERLSEARRLGIIPPEGRTGGL